MSIDKPKTTTEQAAVKTGLGNKLRLNTADHGRHHHITREDEWERRMKLLNPNWQPHRYLTSEIS